MKLHHGAHMPPAGTGCYNCGTTLQGPWCHECGQLGTDFHRSSRHLVWEAMEGLFHADGRLWRTLPRLLLKPAQLTRDYLAGKRASQVPPLRLFFVVLLIVFLAGGFATRGHIQLIHAEDRAEGLAAVGKMEVHVYSPWDAALTGWARTRLGRAIATPDVFAAAMADRAHDFAFLTLPVSALILGLLFAFRRGFVLFDHLVFSMHSLSFIGLLFTTALALRALVGGSAMGLLWLAPLHLFVHMRGVYATGLAGTLVRMAVLFLASSVAFAFIMVALVVAGLAALSG